MNLSALLGNSSFITGSGTSSQTQATSGTSSVSPFLSQVEQRTQSEVDTATTQISKFGLLKSALSDGQVSTQAMLHLSSTTTKTDATKILGNFFNAYNASVAAANKASEVSGWATESRSAKKVVQDFKSALTSSPASTDAMKKLGLTLQRDGTLAQDPKKFAASLTADPQGTLAAMADIGQKIHAVSTTELNATGTIGVALSHLNQYSTSLSTQQKALKLLAQTLAASQSSLPT